MYIVLKIEFSWSFSLLILTLLKELFADINPKLDKIKSKTILYRFLTLYLFYYIFEEEVYKGFLFNGISFKS